jgi:hypothetical protein
MPTFDQALAQLSTITASSDILPVGSVRELRTARRRPPAIG